MKKTIKAIDVKGKRVLVRADFNVPLDDGEVGDDTRIRATLPTIRHLLEQDARVILCSHLGRPQGKVDESLRLDPVAKRLSSLLNQQVTKLDECIGDEVQSAIQAMEPGEVIVLENTRFHMGERENDPGFAAQLAEGADLFVNDAFGAAHRAHASTEGVAHHLPAVAGLLMAKEMNELRYVREDPPQPFVVILGGIKIKDKLGVIEHYQTAANAMLIGGAMANTFLKAKGFDMGDSLVEEESLDAVQRILREADAELVLPIDMVIAESLEPGAAHHSVLFQDHRRDGEQIDTERVNYVPKDWQAVDIGPQTVERFHDKLAGVKLVLWNGPMGAFEVQPFDEGTVALASEVAASGATSIIGGGDTAAAIAEAGVAGKMTHISTGGGAFLAFIEGKTLPGIAVLQDE